MMSAAEGTAAKALVRVDAACTYEVGYLRRLRSNSPKAAIVLSSRVLGSGMAEAAAPAGGPMLPN